MLGILYLPGQQLPVSAKKVGITWAGGAMQNMAHKIMF